MQGRKTKKQIENDEDKDNEDTGKGQYKRTHRGLARVSRRRLKPDLFRPPANNDSNRRTNAYIATHKSTANKLQQNQNTLFPRYHKNHTMPCAEYERNA